MCGRAGGKESKKKGEKRKIEIHVHGYETKWSEEYINYIFHTSLHSNAKGLRKKKKSTKSTRSKEANKYRAARV